MEDSYKKQKLIKHYETELRRMTSDSQIRQWLGDVPVVKYSELSKYNNMLELLPDDKSVVVVLTESSKDSGHWCCLCRCGDEIAWIDSYGMKPDGELNFIPTAVRRMLGETEKQLSRLIKTIPKNMKFVYNKIKYQTLNDNVDTCGRYAIGFCKMCQLGYTLKESQDFLSRTRNMKDKAKPFDLYIIDLIPLV